jgi:predicted ATP-grasp superfamily ATP-dependent carboligase
LKAIGQTLEHKAPLIITKDEAVLWISESRHELKEFYEIYLPDEDTVELLMDKQRFHEMCVRQGWPVPNSWRISHRGELHAVIDEIDFPCILKPAVKNNAFRKKSPQKAFKIVTADELIRTYELISQWEPDAIVQEWVPGGDERIAFCLAYFNRSGEPVILYAGRKLRQWPIEWGVTAMAEPSPKEWIEPIVETTKKIFQEVKFSGLGSIEYKMREGTNDPVIMEPTVGRTNLQHEIAVINGQNIPAIAYADLVGIPHFVQSKPSKPIKLIAGDSEIKASWQYFRSGRLSIRQWIKDRSGPKKYMLSRYNDLGPVYYSVFLTLKRISSVCIALFFGNRIKENLSALIRPSR